MNTNSDETKLALWLDDELHGEDLATMETWAKDHPPQLAAREEVRHWRGLMAATIPAAEEPPYPEFFNQRVARAIREEATQPATVAKQRIAWQSLLMPFAACAGMLLAFWLGAQSHARPPEIDVAGAPRAIPVEPFVYTPENGVKAERFASMDASATVIVLNGVAAIPDDTDFSQSVSLQEARESDATAGFEPKTAAEGNAELTL
jgi:hypothetical protein